MPERIAHRAVVVWLATGVGIYLVGIAFAAAAMRWETFSRIVPLISGAALIAAGTFQFTHWKMTGLLRCRSLFGCGGVCSERETDFDLGCKQGAACCLCCTAPMMIMIVLGMMNLLWIACLTILVGLEKMLPRRNYVSRGTGLLLAIWGLWVLFRAW